MRGSTSQSSRSRPCMTRISRSLSRSSSQVGSSAPPLPTSGKATFVANVANVAVVGEALEGLYADDADWNSLLPQLSEGPTVAAGVPV